MGKKASLKHDLSYEDEDNDDDDFYYDEWDYDDFCHDDSPRSSLANDASAKEFAARSAEARAADRATKAPAQIAKKPISYKTNLQVRLLAPPTKFLYFVSDPRVTLSMLDGDTILHVAAYLPLRSIGALCCANKFLEDLLSPDFLYCLGANPANALPCVRRLRNVLNLQTPEGEARPRGVARTFAIESDIYFCLGDARARNFPVVDHIRSRERIDSVLVQDGAVTFATKSCEVITRWRGGKAAQSLALPSCGHLLSSAHHKGSRVCAILAAHSKGRCRYVLSLVALPRRRDEAPAVLWEHHFSANLFNSSATQSIVKFNPDGSRILFGSLERCFAVDSRGKGVWAMRRGRNICSIVIHDKFVFALQSRSVQIYDVTQGQTPIAFAPVPILHPQSLTVFGGRVWVVCNTMLLCTARLMWVLRNLAPADGQEASIPRVTFNDISVLKSHRHVVCGHGNFLYVASGREIRRYDRRDASLPYGLFEAEGHVEALHVDRTKIVCATAHPNGRSGRIEIVPICEAEGRAFPSVFVKRTFLSSHRMESLGVSGGLLAVSYAYDVAEDRSCNGEIQVFDIQRDNG